MPQVEIVAHDPMWRQAFECEARSIRDALGETTVAIHHIGSTSITGIYAKPVIDILVEVSGITAADTRSSEMAWLGYDVMGEFGIPGRRYFRKDKFGTRTHQVHIFGTGSPQLVRHLAFRDYLIAHPDEAQSYSLLKQKLAVEHPFDMDQYMDGKDAFIKEIDRRAAM